MKKIKNKILVSVSAAMLFSVTLASSRANTKFDRGKDVIKNRVTLVCSQIRSSFLDDKERSYLMKITASPSRIFDVEYYSLNLRKLDFYAEHCE